MTQRRSLFLKIGTRRDGSLSRLICSSTAGRVGPGVWQGGARTSITLTIFCADVPSLLSGRRFPLAIAICVIVVLSGCLGQFASDESTSTCSEERLTPVPFPDRPASLTNDSVSAFVATLEEAYLYNQYAGDENITKITFDSEPDTVTRLDDGWLVRIESLFALYDCAGGALGVSDGHHSVSCFINESAVYREGGDSPGSDPRDGGIPIRVGNTTTAETRQE